MAGTIPFDDRINQNSSITDLNSTLIKAHLAEIESDLLPEADEIPFVDLCRRMNIVEGPNEFVKPKNVGLLFFNDAPHEFFSQAQISRLFLLLPISITLFWLRRYKKFQIGRKPSVFSIIHIRQSKRLL
jgi:hypothetical protein